MYLTTQKYSLFCSPWPTVNVMGLDCGCQGLAMWSWRREPRPLSGTIIFSILHTQNCYFSLISALVHLNHKNERYFESYKIVQDSSPPWFCQLLAWTTVGDNLSTLQERAPKNQWRNVKYKSDVLKTNKDVAFQSYKISLTFVEQNRGRGKHYSGTLF